MDSPYPRSSAWRSGTNSCSRKKQASLFTTTSGYVDPMKPLVLLFGFGSTDAGFADDRVLHLLIDVNDVIDVEPPSVNMAEIHPTVPAT